MTEVLISSPAWTHRCCLLRQRRAADSALDRGALCGAVMSLAWIIGVALGAIGSCLLLWLASRWLARSWQVLDDDQLSEKLSGHPRPSQDVWLRMIGWFRRGPRRLTYRRDERGRFRKTRRG